MPNFVGIVTQQDLQTGVTLRARVTSPKAHYTAYQDFKCMVKKAGLTDEQCVTTDLNTTSNELIAVGVTGITSNLTANMPVIGDNGTNIKYIVSGDNISNYFNTDGIVTKRPTYGTNAVIGTLTIIVTKNAAIAQRDITISVEPYSSIELVDSILDSIKWDNIRGSNAIETSDPATNGLYNIAYPLSLVKTITSQLVSTPVTVTWSIVSDGMNTLITGNRVNLNTGEITRPSYTDIFEGKDATISGKILEIATSKIENSYGRTYMRVGGLILRASISIEDKVNGGQITDFVTFNLKTLSTALTNSEVAEYLTNNISLFSIKDSKYNSIFSLSSISDASEKTIFVDTTGLNSSVIEMFNTPGITLTTAANALTGAGISTINVSWTAVDPATINTAPIAIPLTNYSLTGLQKIGDNFVLTLNPASLPVQTKLVLRCVISINSYSGSISYITAYYRFTLNDMTPSI